MDKEEARLRLRLAAKTMIEWNIPPYSDYVKCVTSDILSIHPLGTQLQVKPATEVIELDSSYYLLSYLAETLNSDKNYLTQEFISKYKTRNLLDNMTRNLHKRILVDLKGFFLSVANMRHNDRRLGQIHSSSPDQGAALISKIRRILLGALVILSEKLVGNAGPKNILPFCDLFILSSSIPIIKKVEVVNRFYGEPLLLHASRNKYGNVGGARETPSVFMDRGEGAARYRRAISDELESLATWMTTSSVGGQRGNLEELIHADRYQIISELGFQLGAFPGLLTSLVASDFVMRGEGTSPNGDMDIGNDTYWPEVALLLTTEATLETVREMLAMIRPGSDLRVARMAVARWLCSVRVSHRYLALETSAPEYG